MVTRKTLTELKTFEYSDDQKNRKEIARVPSMFLFKKPIAKYVATLENPRFRSS